MGHITSKNAYKSLEERINWFTQGEPNLSKKACHHNGIGSALNMKYSSM